MHFTTKKKTSKHVFPLIFKVSHFTIYSINHISNLIYQISYILYKISDILYQVSIISKIFDMSIKILYAI